MVTYWVANMEVNMWVQVLKDVCMVEFHSLLSFHHLQRLIKIESLLNFACMLGQSSDECK